MVLRKILFWVLKSFWRANVTRRTLTLLSHSKFISIKYETLHISGLGWENISWEKYKICANIYQHFNELNIKTSKLYSKCLKCYDSLELRIDSYTVDLKKKNMVWLLMMICLSQKYKFFSFILLTIYTFGIIFFYSINLCVAEKPFISSISDEFKHIFPTKILQLSPTLWQNFRINWLINRTMWK